MAAKSRKSQVSRFFAGIKRYAWSAGLRGRAAARSGGRALETLGPRRYLIFAHDVVLSAAAFQLAALVGEALSDEKVSGSILLSDSLYAVLAALGVFGAMRLHRRPWARFDDSDIRAVAKAAIFQTMLLAVVLAVALQFEALSVSVMVANWLLLTGLLLTPRALRKLISGGTASQASVISGEIVGQLPVLLVGAGDNAENFIRAIERDTACLYRPVGVVDEMGPYLRSKVAGVEILGRITEIPVVVKRLASRGMRPRMLVITEERLSAETMRMLLDEATLAQLALRRICYRRDPGNSNNPRTELCNVALDEFIDHRGPFPDSEAVRDMIAGSRILITGAGGVVGSELARQVCEFGPSQVTLIDRDETALFEIVQELGARFPAGAPVMALCDVRDRDHVRNIFARHRPQYVFHTAAMLHPAVAEAHPCEAVLDNVMASANLADASIEFGAAGMVFASSTDAVNPLTVLAQTRKIAELYCSLLDRRAGQAAGATRLISIRLPQILGEAGTLAARFEGQLVKGGPLTVADPGATESIITAPAAASAILQAGVTGISGGEGEGRAYAVESATSMTARDLANLVIRLAGLVAEKDVRIGVDATQAKAPRRDGNLRSAERTVPTDVPGLARVQGGHSVEDEYLTQGVEELIDSARGHATERVRSVLRALVTGEPDLTNQDGSGSVTRLQG